MTSIPLSGPPIRLRPLRRGSQLTHTVAVMRGVLQESRPVVQLIFLIRACTAAGMPFRFSLPAAGAVAGWSMVSMAVYVGNGITDRDGDRINGSARPIATGALPLTAAGAAMIVLAVAGTALCALSEPATIPLAIGFLLLGWAYSTGPALKNSPVGFSVVIGLGAALTYLTGWLAGGAGEPAALAFGIAMAFWVGLTCAAKDFSDTEGDRLAGRRTWPVLLGTHRASCWLGMATLAGSLGMVAMAVLVAPVLQLAMAVVMTGSVTLNLTCSRSVSAPSSGRPNRPARRGPYRVYMWTQYVAHLAFVVAILA